MKLVPRQYQQALTDQGGLNWLGEPNLRLVWGGDPIKRKNCPDQILAPGLECWCLMLWRPPEEFGPPDLWPRDMGEYPSRGLYMIVQAFQYSGIKADLDSPILNARVLRLAARTIMENIDVTLATRDRILRDHLEKKHKETVDKIEDACRNAWPLGDILSYAGQKNCNSAVKQKLDQMEKWVKLHGLARLQSFNPGFYVRPCPEKIMSVEAI